MMPGARFRTIDARLTWISSLTLTFILTITPTAVHAGVWNEIADLLRKYKPIISAGSAGKAAADVYREKKNKGDAALAGMVSGTAPDKLSDYNITKFGNYGNTLNDGLGDILASNPNYETSDNANIFVSDDKDAENFLHDVRYDIPVFGDILAVADKINKKLADLKDKGKRFAAIGSALGNIFDEKEEPSQSEDDGSNKYLLRPRKDGDDTASDRYTRPGETAEQKTFPVETAEASQIAQQPDTAALSRNQASDDPLMFIVKLNDQGASTTMVEEDSMRRYAFIRVCSVKPVSAPVQVTIHFGGTATLGQDYRIPFDEDRTYKEGTIRTVDDMGYLTKNPFTYTFTPEKSYFACLLEAEADNLNEGEESVIIEVIDVVGAGPWQAEPLHLRILDADQAGAADQQAGQTDATGQDEPKWKITETDEYSSVVEMWTEFKSVEIWTKFKYGEKELSLEQMRQDYMDGCVRAWGQKEGGKVFQKEWPEKEQSYKQNKEDERKKKQEEKQNFPAKYSVTETMSEAQKRKAWREFRYYGGDANERAVNEAFGKLTRIWEDHLDHGRDANYREVMAALSKGGRQYVVNPFAILGYRVRLEGTRDISEVRTVDEAYAILNELHHNRTRPDQKVEMQLKMRLWFIDWLAFENIRMEDFLANPHATIDQTYRNAAADYQAKGGDPEAVQRQLEQENAARPDFSTFDPDALGRKLMEMMPTMQAAAQRCDPDEVLRLWRQFDAEVSAPPPEALAKDPELKATWDMLQQLRAMGKMAE